MTLEELERGAEVSDADLEAAKARWREDAPAGYKELLDAERDQGSS